jgi:hypothetical protein
MDDISLRDYFAAHAPTLSAGAEEEAKWAYEYADAMIRERVKAISWKERALKEVDVDSRTITYGGMNEGICGK